MGEPVYTGIRFVDEIGRTEGVPRENNEREGRSGEEWRMGDHDELRGGDIEQTDSV